MGNFDYSSGRKRGSRNRRGGSRDRRGGRNSGNRGRRRDSDRSNFEMTKVTCDSCGAKCEVPFKPNSDKPVYCSDCFKKKNNNNNDSNKSSERDFDIINEKLNKIMKALNIE